MVWRGSRSDSGSVFWRQYRRSAVLLAVRIDARLQIFDDAGTSAFVDCLNQTSHISAHSAKQGGAAKELRKKAIKKSVSSLFARPCPFGNV